MWRSRAMALYDDHEEESFMLTPAAVNLVLDDIETQFYTNTDLPEVYDEYTVRNWHAITFRNEMIKYEETKDIPMFNSRLELLVYIILIAPTKLVDGVWLKSSTLWSLSNVPIVTKKLLTNIFEEECGGGQPCDNHVFIYSSLMNEIGIKYPSLSSSDLSFMKDNLFAEACLQMTLGASPSIFAPHVLGYTLGYESLSANLLRLRDACRKLHVNDTYFALHIAIDNHHCGHAKEALEALIWYMKSVPKDQVNDVWQKVRRGHACNNTIGARIDENLIVKNLEKLAKFRLTEKCEIGRHVHFRQSTNRKVQEASVNSSKLWNLVDKWNLETFWNLCVAKMPNVFTDLDKELVTWVKNKSAQGTLSFSL
jgi:hypothetical protein